MATSTLVRILKFANKLILSDYSPNGATDVVKTWLRACESQSGMRRTQST